MLPKSDRKTESDLKSLRDKSFAGIFLLYKIVNHFAENALARLVTLAAIGAMLTVLHNEVIDLGIAEVLQGRNREHRLLKSVLHIVI